MEKVILATVHVGLIRVVEQIFYLDSSSFDPWLMLGEVEKVRVNITGSSSVTYLPKDQQGDPITLRDIIEAMEWLVTLKRVIKDSSGRYHRIPGRISSGPIYLRHRVSYPRS